MASPTYKGLHLHPSQTLCHYYLQYGPLPPDCAYPPPIITTRKGTVIASVIVTVIASVIVSVMLLLAYVSESVPRCRLLPSPGCRQKTPALLITYRSLTSSLTPAMPTSNRFSLLIDYPPTDMNYMISLSTDDQSSTLEGQYVDASYCSVYLEFFFFLISGSATCIIKY